MEALSIFYFQGKASKLHFDSLDTHSRRKCGRFPKEGSAPYSQFKGNHGFLRQHLVFTAQKIRYCPVCKAICFYRVPISKPDDLCCVVLKINLNLAPFAAAIYEYQADCDGEWGKISFDFESSTAEIIHLADWDTIKTNRFANKAVAYLLNCENEKLPKETMVAFEP